MKTSTATFLVLLRLAIAWHFLAEGWHKLHTYLAEAPGEKPWSAAGYFREGQGPLAKMIRSEVGDPDSDALALLDVEPVPEGQDPARTPPAKRVPDQLAAEWQRYFDQFAEHYHLTKEQKGEAQAKLEQAKANVVGWLINPEITPQAKAVKKTYQSVSYDLRRSVLDRVADYRKAVLDVRTMTERGVSLVGKDVAAIRLAQAKADAAELRTALLAELREENTVPFQQALAQLLTPEQRYPGLTPEVQKPTGTQTPKERNFTPDEKAMVQQMVAGVGMAASSGDFGSIPQAAAALAAASTPATDLPPLAQPESNRFLTCINLMTAWGLTIIGGCLLLGLLTRTNCILAALFLLMTYLCTPPWPWFLAAPNNEGFYYFINKNVIEMLALLVLATTESGRWFGLDALLHETWGFFRGRPVQQPRVAITTR
jgi:uncharacterized membrane protein YphA (DoxX/SURF4 family)